MEGGMIVDLEILSKNIRQKCKEQGINISQLEKELHFGTGSIGKWGQSSPSIEKVMAVADYFHMTLDEICGSGKAKEEMKFMECLLKKTLYDELAWYPCSNSTMLNLRFSPAQYKDFFVELYGADYNEGQLYIGFREDGIELYISLENTVCIRQQEDQQQMGELWELIKEKEQELKERIDQYKASFINS